MKEPAVFICAGLVWALSACAGAEASLTGADRYHQEQALQNALEFNKTGRGANWENPETRHWGTVTPTRTYRNRAGQDCRAYRSAVTGGGKTAIDYGARCRDGYAVWTAARAPGPRHPYAYYRPYPYYYPYYYPYPYYPFSFHLGYSFGHFRHFGRRHRGFRGGRRHRRR